VNGEGILGPRWIVLYNINNGAVIVDTAIGTFLSRAIELPLVISHLHEVRISAAGLYVIRDHDIHTYINGILEILCSQSFSLYCRWCRRSAILGGVQSSSAVCLITHAKLRFCFRLHLDHARRPNRMVGLSMDPRRCRIIHEPTKNIMPAPVVRPDF